jgi:hypothetical protein
MTITAAATRSIDLKQALTGLSRALQGKTGLSNTIAAYRSDLAQFLDWLRVQTAAFWPLPTAGC